MGIFSRHRHLRPEILSEYLDGRLDQRHQELVARRLANCPSCREELNTLQATVSALQSLPDLPLPRSFTLPTAPGPDYPAKLMREPAPSAPLIMKMPGWAYGSAASLAGLALALMLSVEAAGLASPASFQTSSPATAAPEGAAIAREAPVEPQTESSVPAPEMADEAEAPVGAQAATPPQAALRAAPAPTSEDTAEAGESALAAKSLAEPAAPALEMTMTESLSAVESGSDVAGEKASAFSITPSDDRTPVLKESPSSLPAEEVPAAPADSAQNLATEAEAPADNPSLPSVEYSAPSSPTWWRVLETVFAALTLAFLGGLFFRWRQHRSQSDA